MFHRTHFFLNCTILCQSFKILKNGISLSFSLGHKDTTNLGTKTSKSQCNIEEIKSLYNKGNILHICIYIYICLNRIVVKHLIGQDIIMVLMDVILQILGKEGEQKKTIFSPNN